MRSLPFPERWIAEVHKNFTDDKIFDSFIKDNICVAQTKLKEAFSMYEVFEEYACRKEIEGIPFIKHIKMNETADSDRELLHRLRKLLESGDIDTIAKSDWKFSTIKRFPTNKAFNASLDDDIRIRFKDNYAFCASYRNKYKDIVAKITDMFNNTKLIMKENMLESGRIFTVLCRVCEDIDKISQEMKLERNGVTFSDVEIMARELLVKDTENGPVRTELCEEIRRNRLYELIFIRRVSGRE